MQRETQPIPFHGARERHAAPERARECAGVGIFEHACDLMIIG